MSKPSWKMGGGRMMVDVDAGRGQVVGSHIRLNGHAFGFPLGLDEVVPSAIRRTPRNGKPSESHGYL